MQGFHLSVPAVFRTLAVGTVAILMSAPASYAALVDFSAFSDADRTAINGVKSTLTTNGITATALKYFGSTGYSNNEPWVTLWIRKDPGDHGLGVCTEGLRSCGGNPFNPLVEARGDANELGNNHRDEVIRLERSEGQVWSDFWVSSLDTKSGPGRESGRFYWSNDSRANLNALSWITFNQDLLDWTASKDEGSIFEYLMAKGFDRTAKFVFFRADITNGTDNDYLVYKAGTTAVPVPPPLLLLGSALAALSIFPRRKG